ncbi:hypothetical protein BcepIL02_gp45 [Burkholderia phage BcepIL02]|uniref:Uncharacterized protein n=1 Tax=Burkholderia phage BcepIL02 TaxID=2886898 RepID=C5IHN7_9CAUD|nr:DNA methyltransferase [Burkholderia phage BcepIL02]ACR15038.1 hypothetical protein BcepIL02_gp45 [Burkholderia phage BcepIL02]
MTMIEAARPAIDLTRYAFVRELGDIRLYGTWLYDAELDDDEPCLVLVPAYRPHGVVPCCVALSAAFRYTDPRHLAAVSLQFAKDLGFDSNIMSAAHKIGGIIHDHLLDLIKMPENPTEAVVGASANVDFGDGRKRSVEILDHVPIVQA